MVRATQLREPDVPISSSRLGSWVDCLAGTYTKLADDTGASKKAREGAALMSMAEGKMAAEDCADVVKTAKDAAAEFKEAGNAAGVADAQRMLVHALCCIDGKEAEALEVAVEALEACRASGDKVGEAKLLLAEAEARSVTGASDAADKALDIAGQALATFRAEGDKKMVAVCQVFIAGQHLKKKGEAKKKSDDAKAICDEVLPTFRDLGEARAEAYVLHVQACARATGGAVEAALRAANEALNILQKLELPKQQAFELHSIAAWHLSEGNIEDAVTAAEDAMDICGDDMRATNLEAAVMQTLCKSYIQEKEPRDALDLAKTELERFEEASNVRGVAASEEMMSMAHVALGNVERAMRFAERAADTLKESGDKKGQARILRTMSNIYKAKGDHEKALRAGQEALLIFEDIDDAKEQAITLQARADVYFEKKEHGRALALASEAKDLYQEAKEIEGEVSALLQLSAAQFADGDHKKAAASAREAQEKANEVQDQPGEAAALRSLINVQVADKEYDAALRSLQTLTIIVKELGARDEEVSCMLLSSYVILKQYMDKEEPGKINEKLHSAASAKTAKLCKDALTIARKLDSPLTLGAALFSVAQTQWMNGKVPEATKAAEEAMTIFQNEGSSQGEASALILLADINNLQQEYGKARELAEEGVFLFQQDGDAEGEDQGWLMLERIDEAEEVMRKREMEKQQQWQMQQAAQWAAQNQGDGMNFQPVPQEAYEEAAPSAAVGGGGYEAKLVKLDIGAGLDPNMLKSQILEVTKGLIGYDEEIEYDAPLMESGLTSNTAVLLRDALTQTLPGVNLPVTLVFDYPSIQSMSELIVENAAKAAKKAAKAALKG